jgi:hypothetical protein
MSPTLAKELDALCNEHTPTWKVHHNTALPRTQGSSFDSNWIARLSGLDQECLWIVVSHDHGASGGKETERLPMVCKAHKHPYVIVAPAIKTTSEQKLAIMEAVKHFSDDVPKACGKLLHRKVPHVKLTRVNLKGGAISYRLMVGEHSIEKFLTPTTVTPSKGDNFKLSAD